MPISRATNPGPAAEATQRRRVPRLWLVAAAAALAALVGGAWLLVLYGRGGGPLPDSLGFLRPAGQELLASSGAEEKVLRVLRLAGYDRAVVGRSGLKVVVRVDAASVLTPAEMELTWQTALSAAGEAYPSSSAIVVQVFAGDDALLEVEATTRDVRKAADMDDGQALRTAATFRYLGGGE